MTSNQLDYDEEVAFRANRKLLTFARDEEDERPFLLTVSFTHPHDPFAITSEYWNRYDLRRSISTVPLIPYNELDRHSRRLHHVVAWVNTNRLKSGYTMLVTPTTARSVTSMKKSVH